MKKISSGSTVFYKKLFPLAWFGFLVVFAGVGLSKGGDIGEAERWPFVAVPLFMAVFGFVLMRKLVWGLADEVHDGGDFLLIRKGGEEERVPLNNIMNVNASTNVNPPRITLRLVKPGKFGPEVSFALPARFSFNPFATHPIAEDLIVRVDRARRRGD
jgi:hypothetical protein